jgi:hypothetical protein
MRDQFNSIEFIALINSSAIVVLYQEYRQQISYSNNANISNHQQMHKESFIINRNTLLHVSTLLGHLQGERIVTFTLGLHFIVE